jgi:hypothetical protein
MRDQMQAVQDTILEILRKNEVKRAAFFGSIVRDEMDEESDIDLLVDLEDAGEPLTLLEFIALENHLSDLLGTKVDLVEKSALKTAIGRRILEEVETV